MRRLTRLDLPDDLRQWLEERSAEVGAAPDPRAASDRLWTGSGQRFDALRARLAEFGSGRQRCMYCEDGAGTDIDHFYPRTRYPLKSFEWLNHLLACADCNRRKSQTFPLDGDEPVLVDPSTEDPREHLVLSLSQGRFTELTSRGERSIDTYSLNRGYLVQGRVDAFTALQELIISYASYRDGGEELDAAEVCNVIRRYSFSSVFVEILIAASDPVAKAWLRPECVEAIERYPEIIGWLDQLERDAAA
jgi:hypothetical protein